MATSLAPLMDLAPLADISGASVADAAKTAASAVGTAVADAATGGAFSAASQIFSFNGVAILLGLLLIAAGLFTIPKVQEYTGYAAKTAALAA